MFSRNLFNDIKHLSKLGVKPGCTYCWSFSIARACHIDASRVRNFAIIAHVDHGKSTLADRMLELTDTVKKGQGQDRLLDSLLVEKQRGITVKSQTASMYNITAVSSFCANRRHVKSGEECAYTLNLIDTPGHIDFNYEVSRSLAAIQGVILLVDANEGVQAQTIGNFFLAFERDLAVIPVLNKVDLKTAIPDLVMEQMKNLFDMQDSEFLKVSAKTGLGVYRIPPPNVSSEKDPLKCFIFDGEYVKDKGYRCSVVVNSGSISKNTNVQLFNSEIVCPVRQVGTFKPVATECDTLRAGQMGFVMLHPKKVEPQLHLLIGDTLFGAEEDRNSVEPYQRVKHPQSMVYAGVFTDHLSELDNLRSALEKLCLNDSSVLVAKDNNHALGQGWRLGFLGVLHMEIFLQRLEQEFGATPVVTLPSVPYRVKLKYEKHIKEHGGKEVIDVTSPLRLPYHLHVAEYYEPFVNATIISPAEYLEPILTLVSLRRATNENVSAITDTRYMLTCKMPLAEIITDFNDNLKKATSGLASFDYEDGGFEPADLLRIDFLFNKKMIDEFSFIGHRSGIHEKCRQMIDKLAENLPRQQFEIKIQAVISDTSTVMAKGRIPPLRKDVFRKLHGSIGVERRQKLLRDQAEGKKRLRIVGDIEIPKKVFVEVFRSGKS